MNTLSTPHPALALSPFPSGFLGPIFGTQADLLLDLIITSLLLVVPVLAVSLTFARRKQLITHKRLQLLLTGILTVALLFFEWDLRAMGGIEALARDSARGQDPIQLAWIKNVITIHLCFSFSTAGLWFFLVALGYKSFKGAPLTKALHRYLGYVGALDLTLTGLSGTWLYWLIFSS